MKMDTSITRIKKRILTSNSIRILLVLPSTDDISTSWSSSTATLALLHLGTVPPEVPSVATVITALISPGCSSGRSSSSRGDHLLLSLKIHPAALGLMPVPLTSGTITTIPKMMVPTTITPRQPPGIPTLPLLRRCTRSLKFLRLLLRLNCTLSRALPFPLVAIRGLHHSALRRQNTFLNLLLSQPMSQPNGIPKCSSIIRGHQPAHLRH